MSIFAPLDLPRDIFLLITDEINSPADFVLHRSLHAHLKKSESASATVISVSESWARWETVASRSNINLAMKKKKGNVHFLDVMSLLQMPSKRIGNENSAIEAALRPLMEEIMTWVRKDKDTSLDCLVILDDITALTWVGFSVQDVLRFTRALSALCFEENIPLLIRHHMLDRSNPDDLFRTLYQMCSYHLEVLPLSSGRSGAVSGQIALHPGPSTRPGKVKYIPRHSAMHYRLTEGSAMFFDRGTAGGIL